MTCWPSKVWTTMPGKQGIPFRRKIKDELDQLPSLTEQLLSIDKLEAFTKTALQYKDFLTHFQQWDRFLSHNSSKGNNTRAVNTGFHDKKNHRSTRRLLSTSSILCLLILIVFTGVSKVRTVGFLPISIPLSPYESLVRHLFRYLGEKFWLNL